MKSARAWVALFRPPNFLTVPGDVLAGCFLAGGAGVSAGLPSGVWVVVGAAFFFYGGGLLLNDWADVAVDRIERKNRPIPSGLVARPAVLVGAIILFLSGIALCYSQGKAVFLIGVALVPAIVSYNLLTKNTPLLGALNMGLCRGLNFLLGAVLVSGFEWTPLVWWGGATVVAYIAAVTHVARREMDGRYFLLERWCPAMVVMGSFFVYLPLSGLITPLSQTAVALCLLLAAAGAAQTAVRLPDRKGRLPGGLRAPEVPTPALVGRLIGLLLPLQAAFIAGAHDGAMPLMFAALILALWPVKTLMGQVFYAS